MPRYVSLKKRAQRSEESLIRAIESVKKVNAAAKSRKTIQYTTDNFILYRNLSQTLVKKLPLESKPVLKNLKANLVKNVLEMESSLIGITAKDLRKLAYQVKFIGYKEVNVFSVNSFFYFIACRKNWCFTQIQSTNRMS